MTARPSTSGSPPPLFEAAQISWSFERKDRRLSPRRPAPARLVLDRVSFALEAGEAIALMGPSGSGKSTLARMIAGLLRPQSGQLLLHGKPYAYRDRLSLHRSVQLVQQDTRGSLDPRMRVAAQIEEAMAIHGEGTRKSRSEHARDLMAQVGLPEALAQRRPAELSGGQRQRIVIARALSLAPRLLICDEPTSALDDAARDRVLDVLDGLRRRDGLGLLVVTHDAHVADRLTQRRLILSAGQLAAPPAPVGPLSDTPDHLPTAVPVGGLS